MIFELGRVEYKNFDEKRLRKNEQNGSNRKAPVVQEGKQGVHFVESLEY